MRLVVLAAVCLAACASEKLGQAPPAGVDFSGHWKLNAADSDDPQRLLQTQLNVAAAGQNSGRGGRQGGGAPGVSFGGPGGPVMPPVSALNEGLRWPGKQLDIKQVAGVVAFTSDGINRICQPAGAATYPRPRAGAATPRARDASPSRCGWTEKTLIVQGGDPDEEQPPFEEHYSLSDDGQRLVEVVAFRGGRSGGFTMSRVWDRSTQ
ncbi:MAG: hypothetical protein NVS1B6_02360 [Steroidobacteraceae bacterium]